MKYFSFFIILSAIIISFGLFVAGCGKEKEEVSFIGIWSTDPSGGGGDGLFSPSVSAVVQFEFMPNGKFYYARGINVRYVNGACRAYGLQNGGFGPHTNTASDTLNYYIQNDRLFMQRHETPFDFNTPLVWYEYEILSIRNCAFKKGINIRLKAANEYALKQMGEEVFRLNKFVKRKDKDECTRYRCL